MKIETTPDKKVLMKTGLNYFAIEVYVVRIMAMKGWAQTMSNIIRAKEILNAMMIIEMQHKLFLPIDFELIYEKLEHQIKYN